MSARLCIDVRWAATRLAGVLLAVGAVVSAGAANADPKSAVPVAIPRWKQVGAPRQYSPANLYDLVDGEAQAILNYAFVGCVDVAFAPAGQIKPVLTIDVFEMKDPLNAFGVFGSDRQSGKAVAIGAEGVRIGTTALNFWKGRYVVRTTIVQNSPAAASALEAFARAAAARISGSTALPAILDQLPPGYAAHTRSYQRGDVAGQSYLRNAVVGKYPSAGQQAELDMILFDSPAAAKQGYVRFQRDLSKPGAVAIGATPGRLTGVGETGFTVKTRFSGHVVAALKGKCVIAVRRAKDPLSATALVKAAAARVR